MREKGEKERKNKKRKRLGVHERESYIKSY